MPRPDPPSTILSVRVTPRAGRTAIAGWQPAPEDERGENSQLLLVKLAAAPVDGAANDALIALLCKALALPKRAIRIAAGARTRMKRVEIAGLDFNEIQRRLSNRTRD